MTICMHTPPCMETNLFRYKDKLILFGGTCGSFFYNHLFEYDTIEQVSHSAYMHILIQQSRGREGSESGFGWAGWLLALAPPPHTSINPN